MKYEEAYEILDNQEFHFEDKEEAEKFCEAYNMAKDLIYKAMEEEKNA